MIQTVTGWIESDSVTAALGHEHIQSDLRPLVDPMDNGIFYEKVSLSNLGELLRNPYAVLDNAVLDDKEAALEEMKKLKEQGFNLVADATTADFGRDPMYLKKLSEESGVYIVAGCGCYIDCAVSPSVKSQSVSALYDQIMTDLTEGMDGTGIKAGMIGEIGSSEQISSGEYKFLEAAAKAQKDTGFGMHIHACLWNREGLKALDHAIASGADPRKLCVDHVDVLLDETYITGVLERGAYVDFDDFGKEFYADRDNRNMFKGSFARDSQRVELIVKLIEMGYLEQILITNDICLKNMLHKYGGWGYDHIPRHIIPMMEDYGISQSDIETIVRKNPVRFLDVQR